MRSPPNVKVRPHVTRNAENGGVSIGIAQFVLSGPRPLVRRPSSTLGSNGTLRSTAALNSLIVASAPSVCTSSMRAQSSSMLSAVTLVTWRMRYSSRCRCSVLASKTCQANAPAGQGFRARSGRRCSCGSRRPRPRSACRPGSARSRTGSCASGSRRRPRDRRTPGRCNPTPRRERRSNCRTASRRCRALLRFRRRC